MRYNEIIENYGMAAESYADDTASKYASYTKIDDYIDPAKFQKEDHQLRKEFKITSKNTIAALKSYSNESKINQLLVNVDGDENRLPSKYLEQYHTITDLSSSLQEKHHVYCGSGDYGPKDNFETICFLSTSLNIDVAVKSTNFRRADEDHDNILHFVLPKGFSGGFYIAEYSKNPEELEFLIFPKQQLFYYMETKTIQVNGVERSIHSYSCEKI